MVIKYIKQNSGAFPPFTRLGAIVCPLDGSPFFLVERI